MLQNPIRQLHAYGITLRGFLGDRPVRKWNWVLDADLRDLYNGLYDGTIFWERLQGEDSVIARERSLVLDIERDDQRIKARRGAMLNSRARAKPQKIARSRRRRGAPFAASRPWPLTCTHTNAGCLHQVRVSFFDHAQLLTRPSLDDPLRKRPKSYPDPKTIKGTLNVSKAAKDKIKRMLCSLL